jgi:glycosyltransferase involved in cell wall biosynthesis
VRRIEALAPQGVKTFGHVDRDRLVRLFQAATVFVYPSFYEGFGLPPAEALACGIPTVVSNVSSLPEVVGDAGLTVDPADPGELMMAIRNLLENPARRQDLRGRGLERASMFRWERTAAEMEDVFLEALG